MADSLGVRVGRIISASAHALIDQVEGALPDAVMQQTLREIDAAIDEVRTELGKAIASRHLASKRLTEQSSRHEDLSEQVEIALGQGLDDLAKAAIESQLDIEAQVPVLESTVAETASRERELEGFVAALQAKRREMEDGFQSLLAARKYAAEQVGAAPAGGSSPGVARRVDDATTAFNRVMAREGGSGVGRVDRGLDSRLAELDRLSRQNRVEERLATLRAKVEKD